MRKHALIAATALAGMAFGAVAFDGRRALAQAEVTDLGAYTVLGTVQSAIVGVIETMNQAVVDNVRTAGNQIGNYLRGQMAAQGQIADASNQAIAQYHNQVRTAQATLDHAVSPQACASLDNAQASSASGTRREQIVGILAAVTDPRGEGAYGTPSYYGAAQGAVANQQLHLARYCSGVDVEAGLCGGVSQMPNADQRSGSLLGHGTYPEQRHIDAAHDYLMSLIQATPPAPLRRDERAGLVGAQEEQKRKAYNAQISAAYAVGDWILASRAASVTLTAEQQAQMRAAGLVPTATASWHDAMDLEAMRRHGGLAWSAGLEQMGTAPVLLREIARILAFGVYVDWQSYKLNERRALVEAADLARSANAGLLDPSRSPTMPIPAVVGGR